MLHRPSTFAEGDADDFRSKAKALDRAQKALTGAYAARTGKSRDEIDQVLAATTWFDSAEVLEFGWIDEITGALDIAASAEPFTIPSRYRVMPDKTPAPKDPAPTRDQVLAVEQERRREIRSRCTGWVEAQSGGPRFRALMDSFLDDPRITPERASELFLNEIGRDIEPI